MNHSTSESVNSARRRVAAFKTWITNHLQEICGLSAKIGNPHKSILSELEGLSQFLVKVLSDLSINKMSQNIMHPCSGKQFNFGNRKFKSVAKLFANPESKIVFCEQQNLRHQDKSTEFSVTSIKTTAQGGFKNFQRDFQQKKSTITQSMIKQQNRKQSQDLVSFQQIVSRSNVVLKTIQDQNSLLRSTVKRQACLIQDMGGREAQLRKSNQFQQGIITDLQLLLFTLEKQKRPRKETTPLTNDVSELHQYKSRCSKMQKMLALLQNEIKHLSTQNQYLSEVCIGLTTKAEMLKDQVCRSSNRGINTITRDGKFRVGNQNEWEVQKQHGFEMPVSTVTKESQVAEVNSIPVFRKTCAQKSTTLTVSEGIKYPTKFLSSIVRPSKSKSVLGRMKSSKSLESLSNRCGSKSLYNWVGHVAINSEQFKQVKSNPHILIKENYTQHICCQSKFMTLKQYLTNRFRDVTHMLHLMSKIAGCALTMATNKKFRSMSPSTILVSQYNDNPSLAQVKLCPEPLTTESSLQIQLYQSPQLLMSSHPTQGSLVWNIGVLLYQLMYGCVYFDSPTQILAFGSVQLGDQVCPNIRDLIRYSLQRDPECRITLGQLIVGINQELADSFCDL